MRFKRYLIERLKIIFLDLFLSIIYTYILINYAKYYDTLCYYSNVWVKFFDMTFCRKGIHVVQWSKASQGQAKKVFFHELGWYFGYIYFLTIDVVYDKNILLSFWWYRQQSRKSIHNVIHNPDTNITTSHNVIIFILSNTNIDTIDQDESIFRAYRHP